MFSTRPILNRIAACTLGAVALVGATGCTATLTARTPQPHVLYDYPVVYVDSAPSDVYDSPQVVYNGRPAYLVGSRWYYPADGGWVYFDREPRELRRARVQRSYARVERAPVRRGYVEQPRENRRRYVEQPRETRRRRYVD